MSDQAVEQERDAADSAARLAAGQLVDAFLRLGYDNALIPVDRDGLRYLITVNPPNTSKCRGMNCHAVSSRADIPHSLECQEETTYTYAGNIRPEKLECQKAVEARWAAIQTKVTD